MMPKEKVITVSEFVNELKGVIQKHPSFKNVALVGELSNFKAHHSGHFYFSLKDAKSRVSCVMFRSKSSMVKFKPKDGDKVVIHGSIDVFESTGSVQIYVERMNLDGLGDLFIQFEALKKEYLEKGYFAVEHKKPIPKYPHYLGVIVGEGSAAAADIARTLHERWPVAQVHVLYAFVQGEYAVDSIVKQIAYANTLNLDTIILARGGGSIEDLWSFNEPKVLEAVYNSKTPIISGVGHESDVTLVDYVSDYRAATPTAAAVHATPNTRDLLENLRDYKNAYYKSVRNKLRQNQQGYQTIMSQRYLQDPLRFIEMKQQYLDYHQNKVTHQIYRFDTIKQTLQQQIHGYEKMLNLKFQESKGHIKTFESEFYYNVEQRIRQEDVRRKQFDQSLMFSVSGIQRKIPQFYTITEETDVALKRRIERLINLKASQFGDIIKTISNNNPVAKLETIYAKGFARVSMDSEPITSIKNVEEGDALTIAVKDGVIQATVSGKDPV